MRRVWDVLQRVLGRVVTVVQKVIITILLFLVYFIAFGASLVPVRLFSAGILRRTPGGQDSYWVPASGYVADEREAIRQS